MTKITITLPDERAKELESAAAQDGVHAQEWLRSRIEEALQKRAAQSASSIEEKYPKKNTLGEALGLAKTNLPPPDDEQVKLWLHDRRMKKYGAGLV
jgi:hypothetical protein